MAEPIIERSHVHEEQIDPDANAQRLGERKITTKERIETKKWEANWRTIFIGMLALLLVSVLFVGARGISSAYNKIFKGNDNRTAEENVRVVTDPNLTSQVTDNELKPGEQVASNYNAEPVGQTQVLGTNTTEQQRIAPDTGPRRGYYPPTQQYQPSSQYQYRQQYEYRNDPYSYRGYGYSYASRPEYVPPRQCSDYMGNKYACVQPWYTFYGPMDNTPYWNSRGDYYEEEFVPAYQSGYPEYGYPYNY
jgi:hypothetical protein